VHKCTRTTLTFSELRKPNSTHIVEPSFPHVSNRHAGPSRPPVSSYPAAQIIKGEQQARLGLLLQQGERAGAQAIHNIMVAEEKKEFGVSSELSILPQIVASRRSKFRQMVIFQPSIARTVILGLNLRTPHSFAETAFIWPGLRHIPNHSAVH
jgi:hypothetical protein